MNQLKKRLPIPSVPLPYDTRTDTIHRIADPATLNLDSFWDREWDRNLAEAAKSLVQRNVSARQFQIFELYAVQGWPVREVARTLGVNVGQVYLAKHRVQRLLSQAIRRLKARFE